MPKILVYLFILLTAGCVSQQPKLIETIEPTTRTSGMLSAQYFGTSTLYFSDGNHSLLIDGFFSRPNISQAFTSGFSPIEENIDKALTTLKPGKVDALMVAHSHYDHAMDAGVVAERTNSSLFGSVATLYLAKKTARLPSEKLKIINTNKDEVFGDFTIRFIEAPHVEKKPLVSFTEQLQLFISRALKYKPSAETYAFYITHPKANILVVPSANARPDNFKDLEGKVDIAFVGVGLLGKQTDNEIKQFWNETAEKTGAKVVIPIHWDDLRRSVDHKLVQAPLVDDLNNTLALFKQFNVTQAKPATIVHAPYTQTFDLNALLK